MKSLIHNGCSINQVEKEGEKKIMFQMGLFS